MNILKNLSDRERRMVVPLSIAAALFSVLLFVDLPLYKSSKELEKKATEEEKRLNSIIATGLEYIRIKNEVDDVNERAFKGEGASLAGLDALVTKAGLKKKLSSIKPASSPVTENIKRIKADLTFEKVSLSEISRLLTAMELDTHPVTVERIFTKATYEDPSLFNASIVVNMVERD